MKKESKYQAVVSFLKKGIESGKFPTGSRLPSIRQLSQDFHCSKDTIQRALLELRHEQYLYAKPQSGYYVLEQGQHQDLEIEVTDEHASAYDDFRLCINETLIGRENYLFNYYDNQEGLEVLRQSVHQLLFDQALYCKPDQLVLTSGTQQALFILSQIDFPSKGAEILVEQPTYHRMNRLLVAQGLAYQTIERRIDGIDLEKLEEQFKSGKIKFFYTIPRFHYPLGHSYSDQEKRAILDLANQYGVYIVEDDYLGDLDSKKGQTFHYLDTEDRVIYIKSFSTSLFPALRITALILPNALKEAFVSYKNILDYDSNLIMQKALSLYIDSQLFEKNRLARLTLQENYQAQIKEVLEKNTCPLPHYSLHDGLLLDLRNYPKIASLKHSSLKLDFFEKAYLKTCPYQFAKVTLENLEELLEYIKAELD
ncbi:PLP-dependent aminotransferase family protein [Streptococcus oralis]|uniref:PLP-dependent aminotransferase family protein n=1 Tax=Streptococcus oralis TaxID=1303 RepID=A0A7T2ZWE6_STROR|nr:PLP-dependent aminotransferase family protein [Streptococcus oralis]QPT01547.1 PLP-dependent aminotransferase family protein [Streptococcus oralis]CAK1609045.1 PLP-dependent aminotransferase family protein [Streptococcus oralis subsp. dentisani]